jgi:hypothetical protein
MHLQAPSLIKVADTLAQAPTKEWPDWMTPKEAAAHLKVPYPQMEKWRRHRIGPPYYRPSPRRYRYLRTELDAFLASSKVEPVR